METKTSELSRYKLRFPPVSPLLKVKKSGDIVVVECKIARLLRCVGHKSSPHKVGCRTSEPCPVRTLLEAFFNGFM